MLPVFRTAKSTSKGVRRELKPRRLHFDLLEDRRLLALSMTGVPVDLGTVPDFSNMVPVAINDAGKVFGSLDNFPDEGPRHTFVYWNGTSTDLGAPLKGFFDEPLPELVGFDMNEAGMVVGFSQDPEDYNIAMHGFSATSQGDVRDLGHLGGGPTQALAIDPKSGMIVGWSLNGSMLQHAFLWDGAEMKDLGWMDFGRPDTSASDIISGIEGTWVVGEGWSYTEEGKIGQQPHAFRLHYDPLSSTQTMTDLHNDALGFDQSRAMGVTYQGTVFGTLQDEDEDPTDDEYEPTHGFFYKDGVTRDMGTLGGDETSPRGINASGLVFGNSRKSNGNEHAFLYYDNKIHDLGVLGSVDSSWANGINDAGQVVGGSYAAGHPKMHAFLYDGGKMTDLNSLLPAKSGWELFNAFDINNQGQIVGIGLHNGKMRNFVATITSAQNATRTTVSDSPGTTVFGQPVTFTATVKPTSSKAGMPTGTVTFLDNGTPLPGGADLELVNGKATFTTSDLPVGKHQITAAFTGAGSFASSSSSVNAHTVKQAGTKTTLVGVPASSALGEEVTLTATVTISGPGAGAPTGTVTFKDGRQTLGTADVTTVNGVTTATFTTSDLTAGKHAIKATYSGDDNFETSTSPAAVERVAKADTTTGVNVSERQSVFGQEVTITATIDPTSEVGLSPTGRVTFKDGKKTLGSVNVTTVDGVTAATLTTTKLPVGEHTITASYAGDGNFTGSSGNVVQLPVAKAATTTTLSSSVNPSSPKQKVTFVAQIDVVVPGEGKPQGVVTFYDGTTKLGTGKLHTSKSGVTTATFSTSKLSAGEHTITASYAGDKNFDGSVSDALTQNVQEPASVAKTAVGLSGTSGLVASAASNRSAALVANDAAIAGLMAQWRAGPLQPGPFPATAAGEEKGDA